MTADQYDCFVVDYGGVMLCLINQCCFLIAFNDCIHAWNADATLSVGAIFISAKLVNEVNGGDNVFVRYVSVCLCVRSGTVNQTSLK